jgi:hypothetical protein
VWDAVTDSHVDARVSSHCFSGSFWVVSSVCLFSGIPTEVVFTCDDNSV